MEFRVLGPLEVLGEGGPIHLGGQKQRAVLAQLLRNANRVVSNDTLIESLWPGDLPELPRASIQVYVSNLRKLIGANRIQSRAPGYVLVVEPAEVDALRFEALLREGRRVAVTDPDKALPALESALQTWRGAAYADLSSDPELNAEAARLNDLRLDAIELRIDAALALGRHEAVVEELGALTRQHPARERYWAQLMLALYRSGRQGDALSAYLAARNVIADELGVDPSPELQRLHMRILKQDPELELKGRPLRGYRLLEEIGAGAFGTVYRAVQPDVEREVAVKVVHERLSRDPDFIRRFELEAQLIARLEHPFIVPLYDYWRDPGGAYLAMRYLRGGSLDERLRSQGALERSVVAQIVDQVARALASAHRAGVVHRDVRPPNVLFDEEGNAYLTDFGIAKELVTPFVRGDVSPGLAYYVSPEEILNGPISPAADVYCLGLLVHEMLAGRHPFADTPTSEIAKRHLAGDIPSIRAIRPELANQVDTVIARATALDPGARYESPLDLAAALRDALSAPAAVEESRAVRNPFKGLRPFEEADARDFFGRDALVVRLIGRLTEQGPRSRFLAVVGPSGSGKSSLVRAGLLPALRRGAVPGSGLWFTVEMHPGAHPFEELTAAVARLATTDSFDIRDELQTGLQRILPAAGGDVLIVVDQFEEVFTQTQDEDQRRQFMEALGGVATDPGGRVRVLITLRADFYDRPLLYREFGELLGARTEVVTPPSLTEIERLVAGPVESVGLTVEPGLMAEIVGEVADQPAVLPLLQYALTELFERRESSALTLETYEKVGGVLGALGSRSNRIFSDLTDQQQEAARQVFLRLVTVGEEGVPETRRRVLRTELAGLELNPADVDLVVDAFGEHRLLTFDRDPVTRGPTVEVAHEALLREWGRLSGWIDSAREDVRTHRRLSASAAEWERAGSEPSYLLAGSRLEQLEGWAVSSSIALTGSERRFLEASVERRAREHAREQARLHREATLETRSRTRLRALVAVFALAAVVATALSAVALDQRSAALRQARLSTARELAAAADGNLDVDQERSVLLALQAVQTTKTVDGTVTPEAEEALHRAVVGSRIVRTLVGVGTIGTWSPHDVLAFAGGGRSTIEIRDAASAAVKRAWDAGVGAVNDIEFDPSGSMLAAVGSGRTVTLWDPSTGALIRSLDGPTPDGFGLSFSRDGRNVAAVWLDGTATVWNASTGKLQWTITGLGAGDDHPPATAFSPSGSQLGVALSARSAIGIYDLATNRAPQYLSAGGQFRFNDFSWSPDGARIAGAGQDLQVHVWDAASGRRVNDLNGHTSAVYDLEWSPDGSQLATTGADGTARLWDMSSELARPLMTLTGHGVPVTHVAFSPDGDRVLTSASDGTAKVFDVGLSGNAEWLNVKADPYWFGDVTYNRAGTVLLATADAGRVGMWDTSTGRPIRIWPAHGPVAGFTLTPGVATVAFSPDERWIATGGNDLLAKVWRADTGELAYSIKTRGWVVGVRFSPDGRVLAVASLDGGVRLIDVATGAVMRTLEHPNSVAAVRFSPDGKFLASGCDDGILRIWDPATGSLVHKIDVGAPVTDIAFDRSGQRMAATSSGAFAAAWDFHALRRLTTYTGHSSGVWGVAFSPDGSRVATVSEDGGVRLWDPSSGVTTLVLPSHQQPVRHVVFSPDGSRLASVGWDTKVWALNIDDLIQIARRSLTRSWTAAECRQYLHVASCPASR